MNGRCGQRGADNGVDRYRKARHAGSTADDGAAVVSAQSGDNVAVRAALTAAAPAVELAVMKNRIYV